MYSEHQGNIGISLEMKVAPRYTLLALLTLLTGSGNCIYIG